MEVLNLKNKNIKGGGSPYDNFYYLSNIKTIEDRKYK